MAFTSTKSKIGSPPVSKGRLVPPMISCGDRNQKLVAQVYARLRSSILQLFIPLLCGSCKAELVKATSQGKSGCGTGLCKECKDALVAKNVEVGSSDKGVQAATAVIKTRVITEIENLLKPKLKEASVKTVPVEKKPLELPLPADKQIYEQLTLSDVDWCRYCGTTAGNSWRPGPWGPRSLCFRHGRDWSVHKRLDLSEFENVTCDRANPVLQDYCKVCWTNGGIVRKCHGCANGYHAQCFLKRTNRSVASLLSKPWYCNSTCLKHFETGSLRVTHSTKDKLPLMSTENGGESESETDSFKTETLDVITPTATPPVLIRFKEPVRPSTPVPEIKEKRRYSCPVETKLVKKRRIRDPARHSVPDFLIAIDHSVVVRREESVKSVLIPEFKIVTRPTMPSRPHCTGEAVSDSIYTQRHARFEETEKYTRLLKPDVLKTLFSTN